MWESRESEAEELAAVAQLEFLGVRVEWAVLAGVSKRG
jgi:hypothetical protein